MRTNMIIDDEMMRQAMAVSGIKTKRGVVEKALEEFVARRTRKDLLELRGRVQFAEDYDYKALREGR